MPEHPRPRLTLAEWRLYRRLLRALVRGERKAGRWPADPARWTALKGMARVSAREALRP